MAAICPLMTMIRQRRSHLCPSIHPYAYGRHKG
jgi:hypothetical protein